MRNKEIKSTKVSWPVFGQKLLCSITQQRDVAGRVETIDIPPRQAWSAAAILAFPVLVIAGGRTGANWY